MQKHLTYISLFSSAGIGCHGFSMESFDCIASVEIIERRLRIQKYNNKCLYESGYIADDITKEQAKLRIFDEIDLWRRKHDLKEVDVILSTPPCQGISVANHKKNNEMNRNSLIVESITLVGQIKPKIFIFENVRGFLKTICTDIDGNNKEIREAIELNLGGRYNIHYQVVNFKDYGNPTSRTRTLVIGVRKDLQEITPLDLMPKMQSGGTLREAIGNLPSLNKMGEIDKNDIYHNFRPYAEHMRSWIENITEGQSAFDNVDEKRRPHQIIGGRMVHNENKNGDKYARAYWDKPGPCIHTRNDILASQSTIHPVDDRVFSIRELMKLMSIPDHFKWTNISDPLLNQMTQEEKRKYLKKEEINIRQSIGEAVPTVIFNQIAKNIRKFLNNPPLDETYIRKIINDNDLLSKVNLKKFLIKNLANYSYPELAKIVELSNAERLNNAAYYTRQDICFTIIKDLPDATKYETVSIIEPAVGAGSFLPLLIEKYKVVKEVSIDVVDIDSEAIEILKILIKKLQIPQNIKINCITTDFLKLRQEDLFNENKHYDIAVGNPPFGSIIKDDKILKEYKKNAYNAQTNNIFSFFLEKCVNSADITSLIIPKSFLSAPEFDKTREFISKYSIKKITDYGEKGFKGVKIETISLIIDASSKPSRTLVESYVKNEIGFKDQEYICSNDFPYWLVYRDGFFDSVANKLRFDVFHSFRDRQITKKITKSAGRIRVLKSRNIKSNEVINIPGYDSYLDSVQALSVSKFLNAKGKVLVPNLTYYPRACFLPENTIVDGSVAVLSPKDETIKINESHLEYYNTNEFSQFYKVARNYGTRSLNIDKNSVFFWGVRHNSE
jgi:DNA (cytosine-5)-methyltransferase 1